MIVSTFMWNAKGKLIVAHPVTLTRIKYMIIVQKKWKIQNLVNVCLLFSNEKEDMFVLVVNGSLKKSFGRTVSETFYN